MKFFDSNGIELFEVCGRKKINIVREFVDANGKLRRFNKETSEEFFYDEEEMDAEMKKINAIHENKFEYTFLNYLFLNPIIILSLIGAILLICMSIYIKYF